METVALRGGSWLFDEVADADVFTPEKLTEEHRLIAKTTEEFITSEVLPHLERLESKDWAFSRQLIKRCGELGLLGLAAPEQYGGLDLDKASALVVVEQVARVGVVCHHVRRPVQPVRPAAGRSSAPPSRRPPTCRGSSPATSSAPTRSASRAPGPTRWPRARARRSRPTAAGR